LQGIVEAYLFCKKLVFLSASQKEPGENLRVLLIQLYTVQPSAKTFN